ncbi:LysR family transcriptional regulator [Parasphingopyxis algicola]|uniref:LysR family transcriptional regulator n=1 Tax=Parasphingopyxis algicola TaxID=2026624 RepID=UPI0015A17F86|nr:LysR family transcriptional regulator [Parasphingopyxis algicola]QLC23623.1 LysR family transcriptional regulator [Parasphingopyxis algicola]
MTKQIDRLTLLSTFARIAERGSISAAARDMGLSQASASRRLAALEDALGVLLIARTTHELSLTSAGRDCLDEARRLLGDWEALTERFADERDTMRGPVRIVAPVALGQDRLADAVLRFQERYPDVWIEWLLEDHDIRMADIGADIWIKVGPVPDDRLIVKPLARVERILVCTPAFAEGRSARGPGDIAPLPCAALSPFEGSRIPLTGPKGRRATLKAQMRFASNNIFAVRQAARQGVGYAVMPRWFVAADLESGRLAQILPGWRAASLTVNAARPPMHRQTLRVRRLMDHLEEELQAL